MCFKNFKKKSIKIILVIIVLNLLFISPIFAYNFNKNMIKSKAADLVCSKTNITDNELNEAVVLDLNNKSIKNKIRDIEIVDIQSSIKNSDSKKMKLIHKYAKILSILQKRKKSKIIHMEDGDYKYKYSSYKKLPKKSHLAGNQEARLGYRFKTGGSFYFVDSGGPSINLSINFGGNFGKGSIGINFGKRSEKKGLIVNVPSRKHYYKIKVCKQYRVRKYIVYRRQGEGCKWYKFTSGIQKNLEKQDQYAVRTH